MTRSVSDACGMMVIAKKTKVTKKYLRTYCSGQEHYLNRITDDQFATNRRNV